MSEGEKDFEKRKLIKQGAEAKIWEMTLWKRPAIIKHRFNKRYRINELDKKLTLTRVKQEARSIIRARKLGIITPIIYYIDYKTNSIYMEKIDGITLKMMLTQNESIENKLNDKKYEEIGKNIAIMHDNNLIHGDLTTSNIMIRNNNEIIFIDFGLSYFSKESEDKGVDLYVLERAISSAHVGESDLFFNIMQGYKNESKYSKETCNQFEIVRKRGRKRDMVG